MSRVRTGRASNDPEDLLLSITADVAERVVPRCRHFGQCGGCQLQDLSQPTQVAAKQTMLATLLQRAGIGSIPPIAIHVADEWQYRNRVRLRVCGSEIGYSKRASNDFLAIEECPILSPLLWRAAQALQRAAQSGTATWPKATAAFELFADATDSALQLSVLLDATVATVDRDAPQHLRLLAEALNRSVPELLGAGLLVTATPPANASRRVRESARVEIARWGSPTLRYTVDGTTYPVTRGAFFQVNRYLAATMRQLVLGQRSGTLAYDLFAGAGLFSVPLTRHFDEVVAVEVGEPAATDLERHLRNSGPQHRAVRTPVIDFLRRRSAVAVPQLIVVDPPRAGLGVETATLLGSVGAAELVYVSCDAATFARDTRTLVDCGYTLAELHLLDLFPQTFHTETVAVFRHP